MTQKKYTTKFKTKLVLETLKERQTTQELAQKYEITPQQINKWKREFLSHAEIVFEKGLKSKKTEAQDKVELDFLKNSELESISHVFEKHYEKHKFNDNLQRRLYGEIKTRLHDEMLTKVDRMAMASGLESRTPLLDHEFVEYVFNIHSKYKLLNRSEGKVIFKKALEKYLPKDILYRKKSGFSIPIDYWFKNQLSDFVDNILSEEELKKHGLFNIDYVNQLKKHQRNGTAYGTKSALYNHIFLLVVFQLWYKKHIEN
jgi:asparagine synthetase B (glutamine-hydrolysing)